MTINLFDDSSWFSLRPLTFTRPVADLRVGILTIAEKWGKQLKATFGYLTQAYLSEKYPLIEASLSINGAICPDEALLAAIVALKDGEVLVKGDLVIAFYATQEKDYQQAKLNLKPIEFDRDFHHIVYPEHIFGYNAEEIKRDFSLITHGRTSASVSSTNNLLGDNIFLEEGASAECANLNSLQGPIYLAKNAQIWEGSSIRGAFALGENSSTKMGTKIYSGTTIGHNCRVGGEINNIVIWGNSSKGHDGYMGNSVMGEWCNLGADTNNSNLKNNYSPVKLYDYQTKQMRNTGLQFCGVIIGDHSKAGINTMFNTGTVVGVSANVYGAGFPPNFIADFSWGGADGFTTYQIEKMFETAKIMMARKNIELTRADQNILTHIFESTTPYRNF